MPRHLEWWTALNFSKFQHCTLHWTNLHSISSRYKTLNTALLHLHRSDLGERAGVQYLVMQEGKKKKRRVRNDCLPFVELHFSTTKLQGSTGTVHGSVEQHQHSFFFPCPSLRSPFRTKDISCKTDSTSSICAWTGRQFMKAASLFTETSFSISRQKTWKLAYSASRFSRNS